MLGGVIYQLTAELSPAELRSFSHLLLPNKLWANMVAILTELVNTLGLQAKPLPFVSQTCCIQMISLSCEFDSNSQEIANGMRTFLNLPTYLKGIKHR